VLYGIYDFTRGSKCAFVSILSIKTRQNGISNHLVDVAIMAFEDFHLQSHNLIQEFNNNFRSILISKPSEIPDI